jgi:hypothetical protein
MRHDDMCSRHAYACTKCADYDEMIARLAPHLRPVGDKAIREYKFPESDAATKATRRERRFNR